MQRLAICQQLILLHQGRMLNIDSYYGGGHSHSCGQRSHES